MTKEKIISMLSMELNKEWTNGITCLMVEDSDDYIPVIVPHQKDGLIVEVGEQDKRIFRIGWSELNKRSYGSKAAVNALDITLTNGVYGLLGANGAGKTTLMRLLCNIQRPTSGKILLDGRNIVELGEKYRNLLGYLPQHFGYYPDFSAFDFLLYVSALKASLIGCFLGGSLLSSVPGVAFRTQ